MASKSRKSPTKRHKHKREHKNQQSNSTPPPKPPPPPPQPPDRQGQDRSSKPPSQSSDRRRSVRKSLFSTDGNQAGFTLQELTELEKIQISKKVHKFIGSFGIKKKSRYMVYNEAKKPILGIQEHSSWLPRNFWGSSRSFRMSINNGKGQEIIRLKRKFPSLFSCCSSTSEWCSSIEVFAPHAVFMGTVNRNLIRCKPVYYICDTRGEQLFRINGTSCTCLRCQHQVFKVETVFGVKVEVGRLRKIRTGKIIQDICPKVDMFEFSFKKQLSTQTKTLFLAALVMIDVDYYERRVWWSRYCCPCY